MPTSENLGDVIAETESNIELITDPKVDNPILLPEPTIEVLDGHAHEENLRPHTPAISLVDLLLKYCEKIRRQLVLSDNLYRSVRHIHSKVQEFLACIFLASPVSIPNLSFSAKAPYFTLSRLSPAITITTMRKQGNWYLVLDMSDLHIFGLVEKFTRYRIAYSPSSDVIDFLLVVIHRWWIFLSENWWR